MENHRSLNGSMFMGFLDASKAFDRLKHSLLFQKLIDRKVAGYNNNNNAFISYRSTPRDMYTFNAT